MLSTKLFISCSHKDVRWLKRLQVHLRPLERSGLIELWDDTRIKPGANWQQEIKAALAASKVAVLLVSADFLASEFIENNELPALLAAAKTDGAIILPIIISPSLFTQRKELQQFQAVNSPERPLIKVKKAEQEETFLQVAKTISEALSKDPSHLRGIKSRYEADSALDKQQPHASSSSASIDKALSVGGDALETMDHDRYLDLAVFPEDEAVPEGELQLLWGLDVSRTRRCADRLMTRSLATMRQRADCMVFLNLNDLQYNYVRKQREQELPQLHERLLAAYAAKCWERGTNGDLRLGAPNRRTGRPFPQNMVSYGCMAPWHLVPNDGYFFQRLRWHMVQAGRLAELRNLLLDVPWLLAKLRATKAPALVADRDLLRDDQEIAFVQNALQLSAPALVRDPDQLPAHLAGRLRGSKEAGVNALVESAALAKHEHPWLCPQTTASLEPPGPRITTLIGHTDTVRSVAALPDGIHILSGSDDTCVVLWNTSMGESFFLRGHKAGVTAVAVVRPRDCALSGSKDKTLVLWDLKTRSAIRRFEGHSEAIISVAVVPNGPLAVCGSDDKTLILWDLKADTPLRRLEGHSGAVTCVAALPDGQYALSGSKDHSLILWNLRTGKIIRRLEGHEHWVNVVSLMPDGTQALSGSYDHRLILWDLETGESLRVFQQERPAVAVAVVPDSSRALVGYDDGTLMLYDLERG